MKDLIATSRIFVFIAIIIVVLYGCEKKDSALISSDSQAITGVWSCEEFFINEVDALQQYKDSTGDFKFVFEYIEKPDDYGYYFHTYLYNDSIFLVYEEHNDEIMIDRNHTEILLSFGFYKNRIDSKKIGSNQIGIGPLSIRQYAKWKIHALIYKDLLLMSTVHLNNMYQIKLKYLKEVENEPYK